MTVSERKTLIDGIYGHGLYAMDELECKTDSELLEIAQDLGV